MEDEGFFWADEGLPAERSERCSMLFFWLAIIIIEKMTGKCLPQDIGDFLIGQPISCVLFDFFSLVLSKSVKFFFEVFL